METETKKKTKEEKSFKRKLLWRFLKGSKLFFIISMLTAAVAALADMVSPQIIRMAVDNALGGKEADLPAYVQALVDRFGGFSYLGEHIWIMAVAILIVAGVKVLAQYCFRVYNTKGAETLTKTMRDQLFGHIERLPYAWHARHRTGDIIQRCTSDIDTMKRFVSEQMTSIFRILVLLALSLGFMISMNWKLTLIAMAPVPWIILRSFYFHKKIGAAFLDCDENEGKLSAMAQENLTGVRVVRAFGRERYERDRFDVQNEYYTSLWVKMGRIMSRFWSTNDVLSGIQVMLVVVFGVVFCLRDQMTSGEYIAFLSYNGMLVWPIRQLGRMISEMSKAGVSMERIGEIMDAEEEKDDPAGLTPPLDREIRFDHVTFGYEGAGEMLHDISLTVPAGSTLGILGGTGSGKSTMMYLLDRLYDLPEDGGKITIGGVDIQKMRLSHLRGGIGIVLQEPFLFSRTLRENLMIASPTMSEEDLTDASRTACLEETIAGFTRGYETFVGERGVTLSGGQKQRAAIARMLTQKAPIMIFDDSLSAVDTETDAKIRAALEKKFGQATIILISHRMTTLSRADQVLVLDHGRVAQLGTPEELKEQPGLFREIDRIQSLSREEVA